MHTCNTTVIASASGEIMEYRFSITAEHEGEPIEIAAAITASLEMLRTTITTSFVGLTAAAQIPIAPPTSEPNEAQPPAPSSQPPASSAEAEARFYVRYGAVIGGGDWADVQRYLRQPRRSEPVTVEQWIATAEIVRDYSRQPASTVVPAGNAVTPH